MGKAKNQTAEQKEIHNRAVKIRKMTDEQIAELMKLLEKDRSVVAIDHGTEHTVAEFIERLCAADIRGIGKVTVKKIREFAEKNGFV